jgi:uncharacterized membrane protein YcfT
MIEIVSYARPKGRRGVRAGQTEAAGKPDESRVPWVDTAKGICIVLVVMMHATLGVEATMGREGFMHWAVAFAKPFRLPDFFLVSGLFLARVIDRDWRSYADKRVVHFAYFYVLWLLIQSGVKFGQVAEGSAAGFASHLAWSLVEPFSTLWFVYALAVFSVVTKLLRPLHPALVLGTAALLQIAPIETSWVFFNELCERWVYFVAGYMLAGHIFRLAAWAGERAGLALAGLAAWAVVNGVLALTPFHAPALGATTLAELPVLGLLAGGAGAVAIVVISALLARTLIGEPFRYVGSKSLAVYLTFFLPMAFTRLLLTHLWPAGDPGIIAALVTLAAVVFPLVTEWLVRGTRFSFLYVRPDWAHLKARAPRQEVLMAEPVPSGIDLSRAFRGQRGAGAWQSEHSPSTSTARDPGLNPAADAVPSTPRATSSDVTSSTLPQVVQTRKTVAA